MFKECVLEARAQGRTVLLSSNILVQVEELCDPVSIIRLGRIVEAGSLAELRHLTRTTITAETAQPATGFDQLAGVHDLDTSDGYVRFDVDADRLDTADRRRHAGPVRAAAGPGAAAAVGGAAAHDPARPAGCHGRVLSHHRRSWRPPRAP